MAGNDDRSQDVLSACKMANLDVPTEVAILGVDNDELVCSLSYPQVVQHRIEYGRCRL